MHPLVDRLRRRVWSVWVSAVVAAVVLTGCTLNVAGQPAPAPSAADGPDVGAVAELAPGVIPPPAHGRELEAIRLAGTTTIAYAVFPERNWSCPYYGPFVAAVDLERSYLGPDTFASILDRYGFVAAWGTCAFDASGQASVTASIELSDPVSAARAVAEVEAAGLGFVRQGSVLGGAPLLVRSDTAGQETVASWVPVGRMVAFALHVAPAGQAVPEATRLITEQVGLLGTFEPTPQADVPNLPADPNGLAALTAKPPAKAIPQSSNGPYDLESYLRLSPDPLGDRGLLTGNGFIGAYVRSGSDGALFYDVELSVFPGSAQASAVYATYAGRDPAIFGGGVFTVPTVPEASCAGGNLGTADAPDVAQRCYLLVGNHIASIALRGLASPDDITTMDALLSAQRDLLVQ